MRHGISRELYEGISYYMRIEFNIWQFHRTNNNLARLFIFGRWELNRFAKLLRGLLPGISPSMNEYLNGEKAASIKGFLIIEKFAIENSLLLSIHSGFPINFIISILFTSSIVLAF